MRPTLAARIAMLAAAAAVAAGCATPTTQLGAQYRDPGAPAQALRGATLLVVCEAPEQALRLICEGQVSAQLAALATRPVTDARIASPTPGREAPAGAYIGAAQAAGAQAVFNATLAADDSVAASTPTISIGIGGFGGSGGYRGGGGAGGVGGGVGLTLPVGQAPPGHGLSAIGSVVDVASGRVVWSAKAIVPPAADPSAMVAEAARALVSAAAQAGLF
ncbi:MAG: hypothetical protein IPG91_19860 [Ideonella sp.]|nr:hypothetical protein [Ideonella sp.]